MRVTTEPNSRNEPHSGPAIDRSPRFLIVRLGSLGDVIHGIPAMAALRARYPEAQIDWLVDPRYTSVLELVEGLDRAIPIDPRGGTAPLLETIGRLRRERYDTAIDLQGLVKSAVLARAAGAGRRVGLPREHLREPLARFFYTDTPDPGRDPHVVRKNLAIVRALGAPATTVTFPIRVPRTATADRIEARFARSGYVVMNPGAAWPNKRWLPERFGRLAAELSERTGLRSLVIWGPGEERVAALVVEGANGAAELAPATSLVDIFAIAHAAKVMVSGDTGPMHIAAAVGTPLVALFGPTLAERNGPWSRADVAISRTSTCICHYQRTCRRGQPCINDIGVEEVVSAVESRVARG